MVSLTYLPQKHKIKVFIFLLDETKLAQNNSLFVWNTSNYSRGRWNFRNDTNQVTNLPSLGFTQERIANLLRVFPEFVLCSMALWFLWCCFWSPYFFNRLFCGRPCCKTSSTCISCWSGWFPSSTCKKLTAFTSPPSTFYAEE